MNWADFFPSLAIGCVLICAGLTLRATRKLRQIKSDPAPVRSELSDVIEQERIRQAAEIAATLGLKIGLPLDVKSFTLIFKYDDGRSLHMDCTPSGAAKAAER